MSNPVPLLEAGAGEGLFEELKDLCQQWRGAGEETF
jgi:hypothetical protein